MLFLPFFLLTIQTHAQMLENALQYLHAIDSTLSSTSHLPHQQALRLNDTTPLHFKTQFSTLQLPVIVVDDATKHSPMNGWTCASISKKFSEVHMRREYDNSNSMDPYTNEPYNYQRLGDAYSDTTTDWTTQSISNGEPKDSSGEQPFFAPNYLPWKEMYYPDQKTGTIWLNKFNEDVQVPYFLRSSDYTLALFKESPEMWFAPVVNSGAKTHADGHCSATISLQLSGRKKWRIGPMHSVQDWGGPAARCNDGTIDAETWIPSHEVILTAGQAVIFPPGMLHQTQALPGLTDNDDTCAASLTFQFWGPLAGRYLRDHMARLLLSGGLNECFDHWEYLVTLSPPNVMRRVLQEVGYVLYVSPVEEEGEQEEEEQEDALALKILNNNNRNKLSWQETMEQLAQAAELLVAQLFESIDVNQDQVIDAIELTESISTWPKYTRPLRGISDAYISVAEDVMSYQDVNEDKAIDVIELTKAVTKFLTLHHVRSVVRWVQYNTFIYCDQDVVEEIGLGDPQNMEGEIWFELWNQDEYRMRLKQVHDGDGMEMECKKAVKEMIEIIDVRQRIIEGGGDDVLDDLGVEL